MRLTRSLQFLGHYGGYEVRFSSGNLVMQSSFTTLVVLSTMPAWAVDSSDEDPLLPASAVTPVTTLLERQTQNGVALATIVGLTHTTYSETWNDGSDPISLGTIADEGEEVSPFANKVIIDSDNNVYVNFGDLQQQGHADGGKFKITISIWPGLSAFEIFLRRTTRLSGQPTTTVGPEL